VEPTHVTEADIESGLRAVGVRSSDLVFVHASLRAFGHVAGGAATVVDALLGAVGPEGTVAVPTFTWGSFHDSDTVVFDVANTPSEVGRITEVFRRRPEAVRSEHLCHSVAAIGPLAAELMGNGVRSFGEGSTFDRLIRRNSWYLLLGVGFEVCTALHAVEERRQVPYRYYRDFAGSTVIRADGTRVPSRAVEFLRRPGIENDFAKMATVFEAAGILRKTTVGDATITNARIRDLVDVAEERVRRDPYFLVKT
jgi:aminoglycoside 3-N-acetyltransferase